MRLTHSYKEGAVFVSLVVRGHDVGYSCFVAKIYIRLL